MAMTTGQCFKRDNVLAPQVTVLLACQVIGSILCVGLYAAVGNTVAPLSEYGRIIEVAPGVAPPIISIGRWCTLVILPRLGSIVAITLMRLFH